jgi:GMP synthase (glutamine-hydrolysing)
MTTSPKIAPGFEVYEPPQCAICSYAESRHYYGVQVFIPEVHHMPRREVVREFRAPCRFQRRLDDGCVPHIAIAKLRPSRRQVICGLSGGVDSSVTAAVVEQRHIS